jgi:hypothetical protein
MLCTRETCYDCDDTVTQDVVACKFVTPAQRLFYTHSGTDPQVMKTKDTIYVPPLPNVRQCITTTVISINSDMQVTAWA